MSTLADSYAFSNIDVSEGWIGFPGDASQAGQTFKPSVSGGLVSFKVKGGRAYGTESGSMVAKLYAHTGTYGSTGVPTGSVLATSDAINASSFPHSGFDISGFGEVTFNFPTPYSVVANTAYCLCLEYTTSNYILIGGDFTSPSHAGSMFYYDGGWNAYTAGDFAFEAYVQEASGTVVKDIIGGFIPFPR